MGMIDIYEFIEVLNEASQPDDIINPGASGVTSSIFWQTWKVKEGQRLINNFVLGEMGAGLPASIGAALATGRRVIQIEGDGGFQLNVQELQIVKNLNLPIIMFVINNDGYGSIRMSQMQHFSRLTGADSTSGLILPTLNCVARAYDIHWTSDAFYGSLEEMVEYTLLCKDEPYICEVFVNSNQEYKYRSKTTIKNGKPVSEGLCYQEN